MIWLGEVVWNKFEVAEFVSEEESCEKRLSELKVAIGIKISMVDEELKIGESTLVLLLAVGALEVEGKAKTVAVLLSGGWCEMTTVELVMVGRVGMIEVVGTADEGVGKACKDMPRDREVVFIVLANVESAVVDLVSETGIIVELVISGIDEGVIKVVVVNSGHTEK